VNIQLAIDSLCNGDVLDSLVDKSKVSGIKRSVKGRLNSFPKEGKSNNVHSIADIVIDRSGGREDIIDHINAGYVAFSPFRAGF
jgi:hypothetical protein